MNFDDPRHGTNAGYQKHRKDGEPACDPCRAARAETQREFRRDPIRAMRARHVSKAANRAVWRLADQHREEYERYYAEELSAIRHTDAELTHTP